MRPKTACIIAALLLCGSAAAAAAPQETPPAAAREPAETAAEPVTETGDDTAVDAAAIRFGFRRVEVAGGVLRLNGAPVFLKGFNRHEDSPRAGMCTDLETARRDLADMKRMGATSCGV